MHHREKKIKKIKTPLACIGVKICFNFEIYSLPPIHIRGWLIITTITDARSFLHGMEAITKH